MGDVHYVCVSDMHFGADNSVLTRLSTDGVTTDPMHASDLLVHLANGLRTVANANSGGAKPVLILNGDILDLAFSTENVAAMAFQQFLELTMPQESSARIFDSRFIHIPGNHDHHLWETCRERQRLDDLQGTDWNVPIPPTPHTTAMFSPAPVTGEFLQTIARRLPWLADVSVQTVYPNLAFRKGDKLVIFTHGHFIEDVYLLVSSVASALYPGTAPPMTMEDWEAENYAWIEFVWGLLGRSGRLGADEEGVYEVAQNPTLLGKLLGAAARNILIAKMGAAGSVLAEGAEQIVASLVAKAFERNNPETLLGDDGAGLKRFLSAPIRLQLLTELADTAVPSDVSVVFGHTHKPFEQHMEVADFLTPRVNVFNSGGWVVDSPTPQPLYGGAVILMDDDLNLASLRMYNESSDREDYAVSVQTVEGTNKGTNALADRLKSLVAPGTWPWADFSKAAAVAVRVHNERVAAFLQRVEDARAAQK